MRDENRIEITLKILETIWKKNPDLRLGQLIVNTIKGNQKLYYIEDNNLNTALMETYHIVPAEVNNCAHLVQYECFHCGSNSVVWDCDYNFEDFGYVGEGVVQACHCANCGAEIQYVIPNNPEE